MLQIESHFQTYTINPISTQDLDCIKLWVDVFNTALEDLESKASRQDAVRFFLSNTITPGSFIWICQLLGFNHETVRKKLSSKIYLDYTNKKNYLM